jgi:hypothetical protein
MKKYEDVAPSAEEIGYIMDMAKEAYEEWRKVNDPQDIAPRRIFYAAYYLGVLTQKALQTYEGGKDEVPDNSRG